MGSSCGMPLVCFFPWNTYLSISRNSVSLTVLMLQRGNRDKKQLRQKLLPWKMEKLLHLIYTLEFISTVCFVYISSLNWYQLGTLDNEKYMPVSCLSGSIFNGKNSSSAFPWIRSVQNWFCRNSSLIININFTNTKIFRPYKRSKSL